MMEIKNTTHAPERNVVQQPTNVEPTTRVERPAL